MTAFGAIRFAIAPYELQQHFKKRAFPKQVEPIGEANPSRNETNKNR